MVLIKSPFVRFLNLSITFFILFAMPLNAYSRQVIYNKLEKTYLSNHVIETIFVESEVECGLRCARVETCLSVNYGIKENFLNVCELNNASIEMSSRCEVSQKNGFTHLVVMFRVGENGQQVSPETEKVTLPVSCKAALENERSLYNGVYNLQLNILSPVYPVFCHMTEIPGCGGGGWTLVMKIDGGKDTFSYSSLYWSNKKTFQISEGLKGLTEEESKLASYWNTPFTKICLGMRVDKVTKWIKLDCETMSLYSVIAEGVRREMSVDRDVWKSLIDDSSLQRNCNKNGFNMNTQKYKVNMRIGIFGNNEDECDTCDSWLGFGVEGSVCSENARIICGNIATCAWPDNKKKIIKAFGYILVQ